MTPTQMNATALIAEKRAELAEDQEPGSRIE